MSRPTHRADSRTCTTRSGQPILFGPVRLGGILGALALLSVAATASQDEASKVEALRSVLDDYVAARNSGDADAVAAFFAEDYDQANLTMGRLQIRSGKERAEAYREAFRERRIQNDMQHDVKNVRFLTDDVALVDAELAFVNENGRAEFHNFATFLFVNREGRWLIGAVRLAPFAKNAPGS